MVRDAIGFGDRIVTHSEMLQNGDGIPRARQMLRTVPWESLDDAARRQISWFVD